MSALYYPLTDVWSLVYSAPDPPPGTLLASKAVSAGDATVIATAEGIPTSGTYGLRLRNGSETVRLYLGEYLADEPAMSIAVDLPVAPLSLALVYTNATKRVTGYYSQDQTVWTALEDTVTMSAAPTFGDIFFEQFSTSASSSVSFSSFRVLTGTTSLPYPSTSEYFLPIGTAPASQPPALTSTQEAVIHALVGAQFGDLEFDIGKSVRWTQWFADDVFITDVNYGDPRFWIVDWTKSFPYVNYKTNTGRSYFDDPVGFRKRQFADAEQFARDNADALVFDNNDWVLWVDAHEGLSVDNTPPLPPDYDFDLFRSYVAREIRTAIDAGKDRITVPFYAFVRHGDLQNVQYDWKPNQAAGGPKATAACAVPYYIPAQGLVRLVKVSALRNPSFDWSTIDKPQAFALDEGTEYPYLDVTLGSVSTPDPGPLPNQVTFVYKLRGPMGTGSAQSIVGQMPGTPQNSWVTRRQPPPGGVLYFSGSALGTDVPPARGTNAPVPTGADEYIAQSITWNSGGRNLQCTWSSPDGVTWQVFTPLTDVGASINLFDSNGAVVIGRVPQFGAWDSRIYSIELRTGPVPLGSDQLWTPGYLTFPTNVGMNWAQAALTANPVDASASMRVECERQATDGAVHAPLGSNNFLLYLPYIDGGTYFYFYDTTAAPIGMQATPAQMTAAGVPATGRWQFKVSWNAVTDTLSLHGRNPALGLDLMDDSTGWSLVASTVKAGLQLRSDAGSFQLVNGSDPSWRGSGKVWRAVMEVNGTVKVDFDFRYLTSNPGSSLVLPTGQTCTFNKAATPVVGTPLVDGLIWRFDASEYPGTGTSYVDPRGRTWTLSSAAALVPFDPPEVRIQVVSYGYAHWNLQDIVPPATGVPALTADNDLGWKQRNLLSRVRPIAGLPYGTTWQFPNADNQGKAGPWAPDTFSNQITGVVIPAARPPVDIQVAGVRVPLYDNVLRFNTRDGVWYSDGSGNVPMEWNDVTKAWQPVGNVPVEWDDGLQAWKPVTT